MGEEDNERDIIRLIATDRIYVPISSMHGKLERLRSKVAKAVSFEGRYFEGERTHAEIRKGTTKTARGMREGIAAFSKAYPKYGKILEKMIAEERTKREIRLYFGMNCGCRVSCGDYMDVMRDIGLTEAEARDLYPELANVSHKIARARDEYERSILIG